MSTLNLYPTTKSGPAPAENATGTALPGDKFALDVAIAGSSTPLDIHILAPTGPFKITVDTATDTAADPIAVPLTDRVSLSIRNKGPATLYFGEDNTVTADDTATGGWEIGSGEDFNIDLDASNGFFLITPAGTTALYKILEIASQ